mmetsp:Transcript_23611/g.57308  ORF Transcript_23611/g.57308 Transcript_23611/m.57308 type:complete len:128 (-) Transcript_23611:1452-1835(-)
MRDRWGVRKSGWHYNSSTHREEEGSGGATEVETLKTREEGDRGDANPNVQEKLVQKIEKLGGMVAATIPDVALVESGPSTSANPSLTLWRPRRGGKCEVRSLRCTSSIESLGAGWRRLRSTKTEWVP